MATDPTAPVLVSTTDITVVVNFSSFSLSLKMLSSGEAALFSFLMIFWFGTYVQGVILSYQMWQLKDRPNLKFRGATFVSLLYFVTMFPDFLDWINNFNKADSKFSGIPCVVYQPVNYITIMVALEITLLRFWILYIVEKKTNAIANLDFSKEDGTVSDKKHLQQINRYHSTKFLATVLGIATVVQVTILIIDAVARHLDSNQSSLENGCGEENFLEADVIFILWGFLLSGALIVLFILIFRLPAAKPVKIELIIVIVYGVSEYLSTLVEQDQLSILVQTLLNYAFYTVMFYVPLRKERAIIARERSDMVKDSATGTLDASMPLEVSGASVRLPGPARKFESMLRDDEFFKIFKEFLAKEFCLENLLFWRAVEDFKSLDSLNHQSAKTLAIKIIENFISEGSVMEINISSIMRAALVGMDQDADDFPNADLFDSSQFEILSLMYCGPFKRFKLSPAFEAFKNEEQKAGIV
jgi:hypothetical protein